MSGDRSATARLEQVTFRHRGASTDALRDLDLVVHAGEHVVLVGPNGGGKTTALRLLAGELAPARGRALLHGRPASHARRRVALLPQRDTVSRTVPVRAVDVVLMGRLAQRSWGMRWRRDDRLAAAAALERAHAADFAQRPFASLSGGERQRVLVARALVAEVDLLLLDEPTTGVDADSAQALAELLREMPGTTAVVVATHDFEFAAAVADRAVGIRASVRAAAAGRCTEDELFALYRAAATREATIA